VRSQIHVSIDVYELYFRLIESSILFVSAEDLARILAISNRSAGRILSKMCELGLAVKLSKNTYRLVKF
jgi:predicted transcriptional regulator